MGVLLPALPLVREREQIVGKDCPANGTFATIGELVGGW
jgi:hypothetical protein